MPEESKVEQYKFEQLMNRRAFHDQSKNETKKKQHYKIEQLNFEKKNEINLIFYLKIKKLQSLN